MFGFLKRLFDGIVRGRKKQRVARVLPVAPAPYAPPPPPVAAAAAMPVPMSGPFVPAVIEPAVIEPAVIEPAAIEMSPPNLLSWDLADLDMVQSGTASEAYMVGLIGEQDHAAAVADLTAGMAISLQLEPSNPHDSSAIAAVDSRQRVIGYIAPDSWLREAVYGGGAGFSARVLAVEMGERGFREVVLEVEPAEEELRERRYQAVTCNA